ncbi:MAG: YedE-related selenium metabolism membrane protein [Candidatus Stahlbacteria bacterium]|nr:YedE-related selenium metabolism membrane protein [Candidatus Stahlbacteria bacterium]
MVRFKVAWVVIFAGGVFGLLFALLVKYGNPANMGVCAICFTRDIAGSLGLHRMEKLSYIRPEIIGLILGACIAAVIGREFKPQSGASPILRFFIGLFVAIGALVFLGCPIRMIGRLAGGDPTALIGLLGFIVGIVGGTWLLRTGFTFGRSQEVNKTNGWVMPSLAIVLLLLLLVSPTFITLSATGHASILLSLSAGLIIGVLGQRSRLCFAGGLRDMILIKDSYLFQGIAGFFVLCLGVNLLLGQFKMGAHPIAHTDHLASFLGMIVVGLGSVMLGGCPFRQLILTGQGNTDSGMSILGMLVGTAVAHNFVLAGSPAGVPANGIIAVSIGIVVLVIIGLANRVR